MRVLGSVNALRRLYQVVLRSWRWLTAIVVALALTAGLGVYVTHYGWGTPPAATAGNPVAVHAVQGRKVRMPPMHSYFPRPVSWPAARTATVTITGTVVRAGSTPVWIGPAQSGSAHTAAAQAGQVQVIVAPHRVATGLGVHGIVFAVAPAAGSPPGHLYVSVDYSQFADAYGGGFASRLHLVELPVCAMATPQVPSCRQQKPVVSGVSNSLRLQRVGADVTLPGAAAASAARTGAGVLMSAVSVDDRSPGVVLAATASPSGSGGDFTVTPFSDAAEWVNGASSGALSYSYPVQVPPVPGGFEPGVKLDYSSQLTDGLTSSTNNQASWVGDGWDYVPGFVEEDYPRCQGTGISTANLGDLCATLPGQAGRNWPVTLSLNGTQTPVVGVGSSVSSWRAEADSGATFAAGPGGSIVMTQRDGTKYYFGLNRLPGYVSGSPVTSSQWTVPLWNPPALPAQQGSWTTGTWRWMLDYATDRHGNAIAYFYNQQQNWYAEAGGSTGTGQYVRGGTLAKITYGFQDGHAYDQAPPGQVTFTTTGGRQDAPNDLACTQGTACGVASPTFWTDQQLTAISTQALVGATQQPVDSWSLSQTFPATNDPLTQPSLWLSTIAQTGQDGTTPITLPPTSFAGTAMSNRVMTAADTTAGYSPITRFRLTSLTNTTGGVTTIKYSPADAACAAGNFPSPSSNATQCYPDYWLPPGASSPVQDWFNLYAILSKTVSDTTGGDPPIVTTYTASSPAWHYNDDTVTRTAITTWDQWRGFGVITTKTGTAPDPITQVTDTYFQGKSKDCGAPNCTGPVVTLTSSRGTTAEDQNGYSGMVFEEITYDGVGGSQVTDVIHNATTIATTATGTGTWAGVTANIVDDAAVATYTALAGGGTRQSTVNYTYDSNGRVTQETDVPDTADPAESTCTTTTYGVFDLPAEQDTYSFAQLGSGWQCLTVQNAGSLAQAQAHAVSATHNIYDSAGNLTQAASGTGITAAGDSAQCGFAVSYCWTWQATQTATYDQYGRMLTSADADNRATTTAYTPSAGAEPSSVQVDDPAGLVATATYDPAREQQLTVTDPAGYQTAKTYDALGRVIAQWTPGNPSSGPAVTRYSYSLSNTSPSFSALQAEMSGGGYLTTVSIIDSLGQVREMQQQTASGGSDVTDITYNSDGWKALASSPYYVSSAPSGTLVSAASSTVPSQTGFFYDGAGRDVRQVEYKLGAQTWETDTTYGGNYVTVVPPAGGTSQTTFTDGRGLATAIYQYHSGVTADPNGQASGYDKTSYTYTAASRMAGITDAAGNTWSWTYNLLGDRLTQSTPDAGTTTSQYDAVGQLMSVTDARGKTTSYAYDSDGRRTAEYDTTGGAAESSADQLASWTWDTLAKGKLTSSTSYVNGAQYTEQVTGYNTQGLAAGTSIAIPGQGGLAGTYTQQYSYAPAGQETSYTDSGAGGLPSETVTTGYDTAGEANSLTGATAYASTVTYTNLGQPLQYTMGTSSQPVYLTDSWDPQTGRLAEQNTQTGTAKTTIDDLHYKYDNFGNVTSEADTPSGDPTATDVQCFHNDYLGRLVQAWAQAASICAPSPSASAEGGAAPYWNSYTYDLTGNLTGVTSTTPAGAVTTTTSTYPAPGSAQPHAISSQTTTAPAGTTKTSYSYNPAGQLAAVAGSQNQTYSWNDLGQLTQDAITPAGATTAQNTTYTYDADGNLILVADPGTTTLYLNDEELSLDTSTGAVTGTRYYSISGTTIATRTGASSIAYLAGDSQGTDSVAIDAQTLQVTRRWFDPYGNPRGTAPASFPAGQKGFVGGTSDKATGLTDLGAREYQPALGSFISPDPVLKPYTPQNLNPYAYAEGNPATDSDPSGLCTPGKDGCPGTWHDDASGCTAPSYQQLQVCIANWEKQQQEQQKPKGKGDQPVCRPMGGQVVCIDPGDAGALQLLGPDRVKYLTRLIDDLNCLYGKGSHLSCAIDVVKGLGVSFMTLYALMGTATGRAQIGFAVFVATHNGGIGAHPTGGAAVPLLRLFGACVGGQSFTAATQVRLANGDARPISDLKPGDKVLAIDTKTGKTQAETVTAVMVHRDTDRYDLTIRTRTRVALIHTTRSHLFWDADTRHWVIAAALRRGTHLLVAGGATAVVAGGGVSRQAAGWMWDLTVLPSHDFYILADKTPVLVHNAGGPPYNCTPLGPPDPKKRGRLTNSQARDLAEYLGFRVTPGTSHNQTIFTDGRWFITQDIDSHNHGTWKIARSKKDLATKDTREATTDALLNIIGEL